MMNKKDLILFEKEIADLFNNGKIRSPVHLYKGNENKIIEVFKNIRENDWVFCSWRSHYQCLLKGVPPKKSKMQFCQVDLYLCVFRNIKFFPQHWSEELCQ